MSNKVLLAATRHNPLGSLTFHDVETVKLLVDNFMRGVAGNLRKIVGW